MIEQETKRIQWIDNCRGMAIVLVVVGHVISNANISGLVYSKILLACMSFIYTFHMSLFFFLSGYLQKYNIDEPISTDFKKFMKKEVALMVPYIFFSLVYLGLKVIFGSTSAVVNHVSLREVLYIFTTPIGEYWFLYALMLFNLIYFIFLIVGKRLVVDNAVFGLMAAVTFLSLIIFFWRPSQLFEIYGLKRALPYSVFFFLGVLFKLKNYNFKKCSTLASMSSMIMAALCYVLRYFYGIQGALITLVNALSMITLTVTIFSTYLDKSQGFKLLGEAGRNSMPIYLMHVFIIVLCKVLLLHLGIVNDVVFCIISILAALFIPLLVYLLIIKKVKCCDFFINTGSYLKF